MKNRLLLVLLSIAAVSAAGCIGFERQEHAHEPLDGGHRRVDGQLELLEHHPGRQRVLGFQVERHRARQATTAKGSFSATCAGDLKVVGTAQGSLSGTNTIAWSAQGTATAPGLTACGIALTGTAELTTDSIRVPYSGDTCLGKVTGVETLRR